MKKLLFVVSILLVFTLLLTSCGGSAAKSTTNTTTAKGATSSAGANNATTTAKGNTSVTTTAKGNASVATTTTKAGASSKIDTISKFSDELTNTQKLTEDIIDAYDGMPILALVTPQLSLISGIFYELLNIDNKNGRFEGKIALSNNPGFIEKTGDISKFGYDYVLQADNSMSGKKGDRNVENGIFDVSKQYYKTETYVERSGKKTNRTITEFLRLANGNFLILQSGSNALDFSGNAKNANTFVFLIIGKDRYDFVTAKATIGTEFTPILLSDKGEQTKEQMIALFKSATYTIDKSGGIKTGKLTLD
jgi:hypothetical protein